MVDEPRTLTKQAFNSIAEWIVNEQRDRQERRRDKERIWKEVDRQVAMDPIPRAVTEGNRDDYFSETELPLQFNALEVIAADARALKFPRDTSWYEVSSYLSDKYLARWDTRRADKPLIGDIPVPTKLDQETANTLVKTTIDHFHRFYDFRSKIDVIDAETLKYGTSVARVRPVMPSKFSPFRGEATPRMRGPAVIPCSIWETFLDDATDMVMHEGTEIAPSVIRRNFQLLQNLELAAKKGGKERGWRAAEIAKLTPLGDRDENRGHIELLEMEGDVVVPRSKDSIFMPNVLITVAVGQGDKRVVRFRENPVPFRTYVTNTYMRTGVKDPYGVSPLMKGQPLQEVATEGTNQLMDAVARNVRPPYGWDAGDIDLQGRGGPDLSPGASNPLQDSDSVQFWEFGDVPALAGALQLLLKLYEDLTGVNDPRRGSGLRSHTTASAANIEATKGIARTEDYVDSQRFGFMRTVLYLEYAIIKQEMRAITPVSVDQGGINGWVDIAAQDLPDLVNFKVSGAAGILEQRERNQRFVEAITLSLQIITAARELGTDIPVQFMEMINEIFVRAGINDPQRFIGAPEGVPGGAAAGPPVPGGSGGAAQAGLAAVAAQP